MVDGEAGEGVRALTRANENPWYVLMTLYGEQDGEQIDPALHLKNRAAWNAWACQGMSDEERQVAAKSSKVTVAELAAWPEVRAGIARRHKAEMMRRNGKGFSYPGLPSVKEEAKLPGVLFDHCLELSHAIFSGNVQFDAASFSKQVNFSHVTFSGNVSFLSAVFMENVQFSSSCFNTIAAYNFAKFYGNVKFNSAKFNGGVIFYSAIFSKSSNFNSTTFRFAANFDSASFDDNVEFEVSHFSQGAWFINTRFGGRAYFGHTEFLGDVTFQSATFSMDSSFHSVIFSGFAHFYRSQFGAAAQNFFVRFTNCQFAKPTNFREAIFHSAYPHFSGAILHDKTTFTADDAHWPRTPKDPEEAKASCAVIRHTVGKQGLPEDEHYFFRREMGFAAQIGGFWDQLPYRLFGAVSGYGYSIARPVLWLLALWFAGAVIFLLSWRTCYCLGDLQTAPLAGSLSFSNIFNFFGFQRSYLDPDIIKNLGGWLHLFSAAQTILGFTLLFFLGLGLRTRFRMR